MIKKHICKSSAFLGRMSAGYWWSITRLIELKYNNWPKHIILAFSHWSNDNASHNGDFYGYVRGDDCTTASFPSTNLEFSSYLLSMLRDLKKNMETKKNMVCARARPPRPVSNANQSFRSLRPKPFFGRKHPLFLLLRSRPGLYRPYCHDDENVGNTWKMGCKTSTRTNSGPNTSLCTRNIPYGIKNNAGESLAAVSVAFGEFWYTGIYEKSLWSLPPTP